MSGLLGIWNNANQKFLHDYEDWYNNEHLFERLNIQISMLQEDFKV